MMLYASKACDGKAPQNLGQSTESADPGFDEVQGGTQTTDSTGGKTDEKTQAGISRSNTMVHATPPDHTETGSAVDDRKRVFLSRNIHAESMVACNEKVYDGFFDSMVGFAKDVFASKGGFFN
jgi:hypothetical protein